MISPNTDTELTEFATIFQVTESGAEELPMTIEEKYNYFIMRIADKMIVLAKPNIFLNEEIEVEVKDNNIELIFLGLKNGFWNLKQIKKQSYKDIHILNGSHSASWITEAGRFVMSPLRRYE
jgi:heparin/heparan-sulfate lyase